MTPTQELIEQECFFIRDHLLEKNRKYGDSAINPVRIFSKSSPIEQINVRADDKLSRIASNQDDDTEDAELDLIGYLVLKRVAMRRNRIEEHIVAKEQRGEQLSGVEIDSALRKAHGVEVVGGQCNRNRVCDLGAMVAERKSAMPGCGYVQL